MDLIRGERIAHWASAAPLFCALHCMLAPLLVVAAPALAPTPRLEWALVGVSALLALIVLGPGGAVHHRGAVWLVALAGLLLWTASLAEWLEPVPEVATTVAGSLLVAGAMVWRGRLDRRASCAKCGCPGCAVQDAPSPDEASCERGRSSPFLSRSNAEPG